MFSHCSCLYRSTPVTAPNAKASSMRVLNETKKADSGTSTPPTVSQLTVTVAKGMHIFIAMFNRTVHMCIPLSCEDWK